MFIQLKLVFRNRNCRLNGISGAIYHGKMVDFYYVNMYQPEKKNRS